MGILNLVQLNNGIITGIESYAVIDEQLRNETIAEAEVAFAKVLKESFQIEEEDIVETYIEDGFDDHNGNELYLIWSEAVNLQ